MIRSAMRNAGAIVLSLVVAMALIILVEVVTLQLHPFPPDLDTTDHEMIAAHVARFPDRVLAIGLAGWGLTVFVSSWIATRLGSGRHPAHGIAIGLILFLAAAFNMSLLPYPIWFKTANWLVLPASIYAAVRLGGP